MQKSKTITLNPGESREVSFTVIPETTKTYQVMVDGLNGSFMAVALPFDPWDYDLNRDGYIDDSERLKAVQDYYAYIITRGQLDQVLALPAPPPEPPPPPPPCATEAEKLQAVTDYYAGLITRAQVDAILAMPTCP